MLIIKFIPSRRDNYKEMQKKLRANTDKHSFFIPVQTQLI